MSQGDPAPDGPADRRAALPPSFRSLLDRSADGWMITSAIRDGDGRLVDFRMEYLNRAGLAAVGLAEGDDVVGRPYSGIFPSTVTTGLLDTYIEAVEQDRVVERTVWYDDDRLSGYFSVTLARWGDGGFACCFANATQDVLQPQVPTRAGSESLGHAVVASLAGSRTLDDVLVVMTERAVDAVGAQGAAAMVTAGNDLDYRRGTGVPDAVWDLMRLAAATGGAATPPDPHQNWVVLNVSTDDAPLGAWALLFPGPIDVRERRRLEGLAAQCGIALERALGHAREARLRDELERQALHDPLTGLANRALLLDQLRNGLARAGRGQPAPAVMLFDIDRFKAINDNLGHAAGDRLLVEVAGRLRQITRATDVLARLGGDEFVLLIEAAGDHERATAFANRALAAFERPFAVSSDGEVRVGTSAGIAVAGPDDGPEDLLRKADQAMYVAKRRGRGQVVVYDEAMTVLAGRRTSVEAQLRSALDEGRVFLEWQPVIDLRSRRVHGVEALVRLRTVDGTVLGPPEFLAVAEEAGLLIPLGTRVAELVASELSTVDGAAPLDVHLNLSAPELASRAIADALLETSASIRRAGSGTLVVEVSEAAFVEFGDVTPDAIRVLREAGVRIALDDFGTGWSSLTHLRLLPVDTVKIDRAFVGGMGRDPVDVAMVRAITQLTASLGMESVAEGVETAQQAELAAAAGCTAAQGYLWSRPVPAAELAAVLARLDTGGAA